MCFISFNKGYVVFHSPEIKFLPINIFLGIYDFFFCEIFEPQRVKLCVNKYCTLLVKFTGSVSPTIIENYF